MHDSMSTAANLLNSGRAIHEWRCGPLVERHRAPLDIATTDCYRCIAPPAQGHGRGTTNHSLDRQAMAEKMIWRRMAVSHTYRLVLRDPYQTYALTVQARGMSHVLSSKRRCTKYIRLSTRS